MPRDFATRRLALRFVIALALVLVFVVIVRFGHPETRFGVDDANIFLVYAKHLSSGDGCVFNVGGERVEGFSSPLWVLVATLFSLGPVAPTLLLLGLNVVLTAAALVLTAAVLECGLGAGGLPGGSRGRRILSPAFALLLAWSFAAPGYVLWTTLTLMETGLWSALLIASLRIVCAGSGPELPARRQDRLLCASVGGLVLCRPEGLLWALVFIAIHGLVQAGQAGSVAAGARRARLPLLGYGALVGSVTVFRLAFFGYPLPNTFYAKMSLDVAYNLRVGAEYALGFFLDNGFAALFLSVSFVSALALGGKALRALLANAKSRDQQVPGEIGGLETTCFATSVVVSVGFLVPILIGGDHFGAFRHYQPLWPLLPIPALLAVVALARRAGSERPSRSGASETWRRVGVPLACAAYLPFSWASSSSWSNLLETRLMHEFVIAEVGRKTGRYLSRRFADDARPSVGVISSGALKYSYAGEVVDLMGLNSSRMAHHPGDRYGLKNHAAFSKEIFRELRPDIVVLPLDTLIPPQADLRDYERQYRNGIAREALEDLFRDPSFSAAYTLAAINRMGAQGLQLGGYFRKDYLDDLEDSGEYAVRRLR